MLDQFTLHLVNERGLSPETPATYAKAYARIERFLGESFTTGARELDTDMMRRYLVHAPYPPGTKKLDLAAGKSWHRWRSAEGYCKLNGILELSSPKQPKRLPGPILTPDQIAVLLALVEGRPRWARLVYLGLFAGCRIAEASMMRSRHHGGDRLRFIGKGNREREVPLHRRLDEAFFDIIAHSYGTTPAHAHVRRIRQAAGFYFTLHYLRRTFGQTMVDQGVQVAVVEDLLGHAPGSTTLRSYVRIPFEWKQAAVASLPY